MSEAVIALFDSGTGDVRYRFYCPGCKSGHWVRVEGERPCWGWNKSVTTPTFTPSILTWNDGYPAYEYDGETFPASPPFRCHSFITDGKIQFLPDCTHELKGQTVDLEPIED